MQRLRRAAATMSLLRALQRQGMLTDVPPRSSAVTEGVVRLIPQTLTHDAYLSHSDPGDHDFPLKFVNSALQCVPQRPTLSTIFRRDNLTVGTRVIIAQDADLRGEISVGSGTVIHPKATILALQGPISIGSNCIIEETAVIVNRRSTPIKIGDNNLFEVGCRIEAASVGSYNTFEVRSKVAQNVKIGSYSVIGAGCIVLPRPITDDQLAAIFDEDQLKDRPTASEEQSQAEGESIRNSTQAEAEEIWEELPDQTVVYGADNRRRLWSGEGAQQQAALHAKHLEYLRDAIPRVHKLKIIQGIRASATAAPAGSTSAAPTA
ncbi:potential guanine nucleotide exchange factor [Pseudozyma hubeiensis SY62]|uniref:Dynactin subunit 6 n=1 Tax=Pseudozyma hubeiensis (strain SY62) TaxID=1305764 RepID=R9PM97_PSEHS|nr:potential guanine nucleotide exchange factor [Pseudozyma hubeiensis SY62]GAC99240.1 potential guanine nucleotide exchange factor [Pseudozyma hubeiensis SY62]